MQIETDLAKQIVLLLQEIIIQGAEVIYKAQSKSAQGRRMAYPYSGPILGFSKVDDTLTLIPAPEIMEQGTPEGWEPIKLGEISECLKQFSQWQQRLGGDSDENLYLIRKHLGPLAMQTLNLVSSSYGFWPYDKPSSMPIFVLHPQKTQLFSSEDKDLDELKLDIELRVPELKALVDEFNWALARLEREADRSRRTPVFAPPGTGGASSDTKLSYQLAARGNANEERIEKDTNAQMKTQTADSSAQADAPKRRGRIADAKIVARKELTKKVMTPKDGQSLRKMWKDQAKISELFDEHKAAGSPLPQRRGHAEDDGPKAWDKAKKNKDARRRVSNSLRRELYRRQSKRGSF